MFFLASLLSANCAPPALEEGNGLIWKSSFRLEAMACFPTEQRYLLAAIFSLEGSERRVTFRGPRCSSSARTEKSIRAIHSPHAVVFHDLVNEGAEYLLLGEQSGRADELPEVKVFRVGRDGGIRATHTIGRGTGGRIVKDGAAGYWIVGWTTRAAIWRVEKSGRVANEKVYDCDAFTAAKATTDGLFVAGMLDRSELTADVCLFQIDANHATIWSRTLASNPSNQRTYIHWMLPESTQGLLLGGGHTEIENSHFEGFAFAAVLK